MARASRHSTGTPDELRTGEPVGARTERCAHHVSVPLPDARLTRPLGIAVGEPARAPRQLPGDDGHRPDAVSRRFVLGDRNAQRLLVIDDSHFRRFLGLYREEIQ